MCDLSWQNAIHSLHIVDQLNRHSVFTTMGLHLLQWGYLAHDVTMETTHLLARLGRMTVYVHFV